MFRKASALFLCLVLAAGAAARAGEGEKKLKWFEKTKFGGDLRLRAEHFNWDEHYDDGERTRFRYRLRVGFKTAVSENVTIGFQLRSGNPDNPHSDNQSFDSGFDKDSISLAEIFVRWQATGNLTVYGGKFSPKKLWHVSDMHWDDDVVTEGALESWEWQREGTVKKVELNLYQFILEESGSGDDAYMFGGQIAPTFELNETNDLTVGAGYDTFSKPDRVVGLTFGGSLDTEPEGIVTNLIDPLSGELVSDFDVASLFAVWKNRSSKRWPVKVSLFYYVNLGAENAVGSILEADDGMLVPLVSDLVSDENDTAFYGRVQVGDYKKPGQVAVRFTRYDSKPDAMFYAWVQSDTKRGTNLEGNRFDLRIGMPKKAYINVTWYNTDWKYGDDPTMDRWQADYIFKF
jgi:hypothetical protein